MEYDEKSNELTRLQKVTKTVFLVLVWVCIGLSMEITGPTLIDLKIRIHTDYESMATAFSGRSVGFFIGSILGGVLVDKLGRYCDILMAICIDFMALSIVTIAWAPMVELIFVISVCGGLFEGVINIAGQKLIMNMWKENSASPLHILHGGYGIGSFIIPLIANPFLAQVAHDVRNDTPVTFDTNFTTTLAPRSTTEKKYLAETSRIEYAYTIAGMITVAVSIVFYVYHCLGWKDRQRSKTERNGNASKNETRTLTFKEMFNPETCSAGRFCYGLQILILVFLFFMQAIGGERVSGMFIRTFAIDYHNFTNDNASYINTVFWVAFSCGRVAAFVAARWIPIRILIVIETGGCLASSIALVFLGTSGPLELWIIIAILAVFIGPLIPSGIGWANFHIEVTGITMTVFLLGGSIGGIVYLKVIGFLYDHYGPKMFIYTILGYGVAAFITSILMDIIGSQHGSRFNTIDDDAKQEIMGHDLSTFIDKAGNGNSVDDEDN